jgi:hypothetical protein
MRWKDFLAILRNAIDDNITAIFTPEVDDQLCAIAVYIDLQKSFVGTPRVPAPGPGGRCGTKLFWETIERNVANGGNGFKILRNYDTLWEDRRLNRF